jgi:hypothetical protein
MLGVSFDLFLSERFQWTKSLAPFRICSPKPMQKLSPPPTKQRRIGFWITIAAALVYCLWLGTHWVPLGFSEHELAASASRVWDIQRELAQHHHLPWWTPYFMSGSSYGLNHSRGFYLIPWMLLSQFTSLEIAGKLTALAAIFASALTMYYCARYFLQSEWAAFLAAMAFMLHPEQVIRAAGAEHITIALSFPFSPLLWLTFARMLESNRFRDVFVCAVVAVLAWWTDNKQAFIQFLFLFGWFIYWLWPRRAQWKVTVRTCAWLALGGLALGAPVIVPGVLESKYVKLFRGDPLTEWQKSYAFKSLLGTVDRNGEATSNVVDAVMGRIQANGGRANSQAEVDQIRRVFGLKMDAPEKYMGLVLVLVLAITVLWNDRRVDRRAFWFFLGSLLVSVMLATGLSSVWGANWATWEALASQGQIGAASVALLACLAFLVFFYLRKLTTTKKKVFAGMALAVFLFLPGFQLLAGLPYFSDIRAPFVFYDGPAVFWGAMLIGFFVSDVLCAEKWRPHIPKIVAGIVALMLLDYWPYQKPMCENQTSKATLQNLRASYEALHQDSDPVKVYALSGRYFHLLGPMWSGKPQVYEAFYNWMSPIGTGLLNQQAFLQLPDRHVIISRPFLNLMGARYIVFDLGSPAIPDPQSVLNDLSQNYRVVLTNADFAVFRNDTAHPYVTAYARACLFVGDFRESAQLAMALSANGWPLVNSETERTGTYAQVYRDAGGGLPPFGSLVPVTLGDLNVTRERDELVRIKAATPTNCLAVIAESFYPFWHAEVDGQPAEVLRVSCGLMGVELKAGSHEIVLRYEPPRSYAASGLISVIALLAGIGVSVFSRMRPESG